VFSYYFGLAIRSLERNVVLTVLMIAAIAVGIGASMTTLTVFRAMAADPIPEKSSQLFAVQIDNWGPGAEGNAGDQEHLQQQISYTDAKGLMIAHGAHRQSAMYVTGFALTPANPQLRPFQVQARAAFSDFFAMFNVPFLFGAPWSVADDEGHADVVVITRDLNDKVFGGADSIGQLLNLDDHDYRVVGVLDRWEPIPKFYDLNNSLYGTSEQIFVPFTRAIESQMWSWGNNSCAGEGPAPGWEGRLQSECVWLQFWAELPTAADVDHYRSFLSNYAGEQQRLGRFHWPPNTRLRNVHEWLTYRHVVSDEVKILLLVSFSFLLVCLLNAMGLMLAKIMSRAADIGVRRALGASRGAIFSQCLLEAAVVGAAGGLVGLALTALGLVGLRSALSEQVTRLTYLHPADMSIALIVAIIATILAGLYPTWRATQLQPAWQLKAQ
jgi:putative ABC transport system permease protein